MKSNLAISKESKVKYSCFNSSFQTLDNSDNSLPLFQNIFLNIARTEENRNNVQEIENNNNIAEAESNTKTINQCLSVKSVFMIFLIIENQNNVIKKQ